MSGLPSIHFAKQLLLLLLQFARYIPRKTSDGIFIRILSINLVLSGKDLGARHSALSETSFQQYGRIHDGG